jgi:quercetin dioxygenase-like cupin family protein
VLILAGGGRVKIDDEVRKLKPRDAIRFAPGSTRAFEAGPDGLEFVVFGPHHRGDAVMDQDFWPTETAPQ